MGNKLAGTQGLTIVDQNNIDDTVARLCKNKIYTRAECGKQTEASAARRKGS